MEVREQVQKGQTYIILEGITEADLGFKNFAGDPEKSKVRSTQKTFGVHIPEKLVPWFKDHGIPVDERVRTDDYGETITYNIYAIIDFSHLDWYPCNVYYAVDGGDWQDLPDEQVNILDNVMEFTNIDLKLRVRTNKDTGRKKLYLTTGYFDTQSDDFDSRHRRGPAPEATDGLAREAGGFGMPEPESEELPFED